MGVLTKTAEKEAKAIPHVYKDAKGSKQRYRDVLSGIPNHS